MPSPRKRALHRQRLRLAAEDRVKAHEEYQLMAAELATTIRDARGAGIPVTEIAELVGVTRQSVYNLLR